MACESVAPPIIQVFPGADVACGQGGATFEGNPAHSGTGLISSSPPTLTTSSPTPSGAALLIPHGAHSSLQRRGSVTSFATTVTAVGCDGSPSPGAEPGRSPILGGPIVDEPSSMEGSEVSESSILEVSKKEPTVYLSPAPMSMWMTARYLPELVCVSSMDHINRLL